jgi:hypothetical protein
MTTKTVNLYTFDELSDSAKEKARQWWREASSDDTFWSECTIEEAKEQGRNMGLDIDKIYWSGFWSQGDGACYVGSWNASRVKVGETAKDWGDSPATEEIRRIASQFEQFAQKWPESSFTVKHSGHYSHEFCTDFLVEFGNEIAETGEWNESLNDAEKHLIETARDYMRWIYKQLEKEYEYQNSDEVIDELLEGNSYTFTVEGKRED